MKKAALALTSALALASMANAAKAEPALPVPEGYVPIAASVAPDKWWLLEDTVIVNVSLTTAWLLTFTTDEAQKPVYLRAYFVARCGSDSMSLSKRDYFTADGAFMGRDEKATHFPHLEDMPGTVEHAIYEELCDRQ